MFKNKNFNKARKEKNDEFYTQLIDIENELSHYREYFENKIIYCNCDNPEFSNFYTYFLNNCLDLKFSKVIFTYISECSYKVELIFQDGKLQEHRNKINSGDFRSLECVDILKECDIVVTNPPFSLFRDYISLLMKYNKKFLIIGNAGAIIYKDIFNLIKTNKINFGFSKRGMNFIHNNSLKSVNAIWYTNLKIFKRYFKFTNSAIPEKLLNFDAININNCKDIPDNYFDIMAVPITFLEKLNSDQFEIIGSTRHSCELVLDLDLKNLRKVDKNGNIKYVNNLGQSPYIVLKEKPINKIYYLADNINGYIIELYQRLLIKRK